jgi:hypothetical protein
VISILKLLRRLRHRPILLVCSVGFLLIPSAGAFAQKLGQAVDTDVSIWRIVAVFFLCILLAVAGAFLLRGGVGASFLPLTISRKSRRLELVETLRLNPHVSLCIVNCDGDELLVSVSSQGARVLSPKAVSAGDHQIDIPA